MSYSKGVLGATWLVVLLVGTAASSLAQLILEPYQSADQAVASSFYPWHLDLGSLSHIVYGPLVAKSDSCQLHPTEPSLDFSASLSDFGLTSPDLLGYRGFVDAIRGLRMSAGLLHYK